ncbi:Monocarboxylate transporter 1 [Armadillidium vulgare]|nr:Monocarboxylate transporter 1 [Armadillidium vulgare]
MKHVCCFFPVFGFSILFHPTLISKVSSSKIAWIMSFRLFGNVAVIFVGPLCQEFGWRKVAIVGGILNFLSIFLSVFISNPDFLFFSFGLLGGISGAAGVNLTYIVISRYFRKRRGFAVATAALGICLASFLSPLTANYLMEIYGQRGTCLIFGALLLNQCVAGALFQPVEWHLIPVNSSVYKSKDNQNEEKLLNIKPPDEIDSLSIQKSKRVRPISYTLKSSHEEPTINFKKKFPTANDQDDNTHHSKSFYSIFKRIIVSTHESILTLKFMRVKIISLGSSCLLLGNIGFQMWIPFVISNSGYSLELSAWCVSISSVTNGTGQILMSLLSDRKWFNIKYGYIFSIFLIGLSIIAFSIVEELKLFIVCVCFWGFGVGVSLTLQPVERK